MAKAAKAEINDQTNDPCRVLTPVGRGSYLHIFKAASIQGSAPKYSCTLLFDKKKTDMQPLIKAKNTALRAKFGPDKDKWPKGLDNPIRDGDAEKFSGKEGYAGHWVVKASANEEFKPGVFDQDGDPIIDSTSLVSGDYIRARIYAIAWDTAGNRGASFLLDGVQLVKKGVPLSARGALKFDPVGGQEESDETDNSEDNEDADDFT